LRKLCYLLSMINFTAALAQRLNEYRTRNGFTYFKEYIVETQTGRKFAKVFSVEVGHDNSHNHRRIVAFVDINTGDIFKPAGFNAPAKHARGNVNSPTFGMEAINESGHVYYLRG